MIQKKPFVIILIGPPGAGKGTHAIRLSQELHLPHIATGDLFREHLQKETPLGKKANAYINEGKLVPDEIVIEMLFDRIAQPDCKKGYILDGFPRTLAQAKALEEHLNNQVQLVALNLNVEDDIIIERLSNRLICKQCGAPFHKLFIPPKVENQCDFCQGPLYQRADDTEDVVKERLSVYHTQTEPLLSYYHSLKDTLFDVPNDGNDKEKIYKNLIEILKKVI